MKIEACKQNFQRRKVTQQQLSLDVKSKARKSE